MESTTTDAGDIPPMTTNSGDGSRSRTQRGRQRSPGATILGRVQTGIWSLLVVAFIGAVGFAAFSVLSGGWTVAPILSGSMSPGFPVGGVAVAERVPMTSLAVGDVIIFQNPYQRSVEMVHRIIQLKVNKSGQPVVKTKGDANPVADPWTVTLHGKYVYMAQFTLPLLGYPAVYTNHSVDLIVAGVVLLGVVLATVLMQTRKRKPLPQAAAPWRLKQ